MMKILFDTKMNEARNILINHRKMLKKNLPEDWKILTLFAPIQYEKTTVIGKKRYVGYLRSRWGYPFSIEIYEKGRKFKLKKSVFSHKSVDMEKDNPPVKSMRIIDRQFDKMKKKVVNI